MCDFLETYTAKYRAWSDSLAAAGRARGRGRAGKGRGRGGHPWDDALPPALVIGERITQPELKVYCPPGGSVWESRCKLVGGWNGALPPNPRMSCSGAAAGSHRDAGFSVIRRLWQQYLDKHGLPRSACPVDGLL